MGPPSFSKRDYNNLSPDVCILTSRLSESVEKLLLFLLVTREKLHSSCLIWGKFWPLKSMQKQHKFTFQCRFAKRRRTFLARSLRIKALRNCTINYPSPHPTFQKSWVRSWCQASFLGKWLKVQTEKEQVAKSVSVKKGKCLILSGSATYVGVICDRIGSNCVPDVLSVTSQHNSNIFLRFSEPFILKS